MPKRKQKVEVFGVPLIKWTAKEYIKYYKGMAWTTGAIVTSAALIAYALLIEAWTMAVVFAVMIGVYYLHHRQHPSDVNIAITDIGVLIGLNFYPYSHMKAFWIIYDPPYVKTLHIRFTKKSTPDLVIQLGDQDPVPVRNALLSQIPEWQGKEEAPMDAIIRLLKL